MYEMLYLKEKAHPKSAGDQLFFNNKLQIKQYKNWQNIQSVTNQ